jgi:hypothetical protein
MAGNRWQLIVGLVILISMLVTAAFAFGVYVGQHGLLGSGLSVIGNKNPQQGIPGANNSPVIQGQGLNPQGQQPVWQPIPGLPAQPPEVVGRIQRIRPTSITLNTQSGVREIMLGETVILVTITGKTLSLTDLQRGDTIGIYGASQTVDGGQFTAEYIVRLPVNQ